VGRGVQKCTGAVRLGNGYAILDAYGPQSYTPATAAFGACALADAYSPESFNRPATTPGCALSDRAHAANTRGPTSPVSLRVLRPFRALRVTGFKIRPLRPPPPPSPAPSVPRPLRPPPPPRQPGETMVGVGLGWTGDAGAEHAGKSGRFGTPGKGTGRFLRMFSLRFLRLVRGLRVTWVLEPASTSGQDMRHDTAHGPALDVLCHGPYLCAP
jgi:hypothetical protein